MKHCRGRSFNHVQAYARALQTKSSITFTGFGRCTVFNGARAILSIERLGKPRAHPTLKAHHRWVRIVQDVGDLLEKNSGCMGTQRMDKKLYLLGCMSVGALFRV